MFYANGGLRGYFSDGTITSCARCDLTQENVKALYFNQIIARYNIEGDSLVLDDGEKEYPDSIQDWAMIDFNWIKPIEDTTVSY